MEDDLHIFDEAYPTDEDIYKFLVKDCQQLFDDIGEQQKLNTELNQLMSDQRSQCHSVSEQIGIKALDQQFEKQKALLLSEKKMLENQFLDIMLDIQKKKKQYVNFQDQLDSTNQNIMKNEKTLKEKQQFIQFLESEIENLITVGTNQTKL
eukprot:TRINITY_DN37643_c0_g1_i1.p2 TRINITY_DN37643_c0_g1~~TRINITY_DN37643_c0_g1_i1.p2  ORF type:complete len:151 (+),score=37.74 TRINITY_DN37643_c0_g1_i1:204-656(+)